jgi:hypothetical protein
MLTRMLLKKRKESPLISHSKLSLIESKSTMERLDLFRGLVLDSNMESASLCLVFLELEKQLRLSA